MPPTLETVTTRTQERWECPPPPPALLTQDSMPRERRHLAGVTWEGGLVVLFSFLLSGECSLGAHGLLRFRTNDVLLGTSGVGVCVSVVSNSPGNVLRVSVAEWTLPLDHHLLCLLRPSAARWSSGFRIESAALTLIIFSHLSGPNFCSDAPPNSNSRPHA